jgi:hypothetical protein
MNGILETKITNLKDIGNVILEGYNYYKKKVEPEELLILPEACFKWYNLFPTETEINQEQVFETREFIKNEIKSGRLNLEKELGFVILHRAGDYLLLLITTWRNTNEMWESVYFKKAVQSEAYKQIEFKNNHKGTYCVWELSIVWHERNAWLNFIQSKRNEEAKLKYLNDLFSGMV